MLETACACVRLYFWDMLGMVQAVPGGLDPSCTCCDGAGGGGGGPGGESLYSAAAAYSSL